MLVDGVVGATQIMSIRVYFVANVSVLVAVLGFVLYFCTSVFLLIEETALYWWQGWLVGS